MDTELFSGQLSWIYWNSNEHEEQIYWNFTWWYVETRAFA